MTKASSRAGGRQWAGLGLLALPTALLGLDVTVLYLVLPSLAADLAPSATQTLWIMDAYGFLIAGFLVTMGTLGDRIGRRRLLMIGMACFAAVSVLAAVAPTAELLILARALLGIAGATLMPSTLSLISNMFPDPAQRAVAIGFWATMFASGMAVGPIVGGALVATTWWGAAFLPAVPIAAVVLVAAPLLLPEHADPRAGRIDPVSVMLSLGALLPAVAAIKRIAGHGADAVAVVLAIVGILAGVLFVRRQRRITAPLLDVSLFRSGPLSVSLVVLLIGLVGVGGTMYLVTQYFQLVEGLSPFVAGLWMGPSALVMLLAAIGAPVLARRVRPGLIMGATLAASVAGYLLLGTAGPDDGPRVAAGFALVYLGLGAVAALGTDIVIGAAPAARAGSAASLSETVQELGIAVGVAVLGSVATAVHRARAAREEALGAGVADILAASVGREEEVPAHTLLAAQDAFVSGLNAASLVAAVVVAIAAALCLALLRAVRPLAPGADAVTVEPFEEDGDGRQ